MNRGEGHSTAAKPPADLDDNGKVQELQKLQKFHASQKSRKLHASQELKEILEILEIKQFSGLFEQIFRATGLASAVLDLEGNILCRVASQSICTKFHRKSEVSARRCMESDAALTERLKNNEKYAICVCQNGLVDAAIPIIVNNVHAANLFTGQFFTEAPDKELFICQAEEYGFDKEQYMKSLEECQVYTKDSIDSFMGIFYEIVCMISVSAQKSLELKEQNKEKKERTAELYAANRELNMQSDEISYIDSHDVLTGLYNRTFFEAEKKRLTSKGQYPVSIIVGDINGLKLINYGFGHAKGDEVIVEIAGIIKKCCREEDVISRIGGGEFSIMLPRADIQAARQVSNRIYEACRGCSCIGSEMYPSISIGYATKMTETETIHDTLVTAEQFMSKRKLLETHSAHNAIITSIKAIMIEKSQETEEHAERLLQLSELIGSALSLSENQHSELELLAILHDIGKVGIPGAVLSKPGKLTDEEWIIMKRHPEVGCRIAQATSELAPIAQYILCHHERWDGKGYPRGLAGEQIPLLSRILSIVDSFDAMTNDRSYRTAMTEQEAIEEIRKCSGTQFDPDISKTFVKLLSCRNELS